MKKIFIICFFISVMVLASAGQGPVQEKVQTKKKSQENVILPKTEEHEVAVRLVLVDVVATDRQGNVVGDLTKEDFEIFEDGQLQTVSSLDYIKLQEAVMNEPEEGIRQRKKSFFVIFDSINSTKRILDRNRDQIMEKMVSLSHMGHEVMVLELREDKNMEILQQLTADESLITAGK